MFDRLRVIKLERMAHGHAYWMCKCACGRRVVARGTLLVNGRVRSCGCLRAEPEVRRAARMQVTPRKRRAIARAGARARWKRK